MNREKKYESIRVGSKAQNKAELYRLLITQVNLSTSH